MNQKYKKSNNKIPNQNIIQAKKMIKIHFFFINKKILKYNKTRIK